LYFLISNLNKIIKTFFNSVFSLIPFYSNKITDRLNNSNFRNFIGYIKSNISDYNYVFHWDKLKESHQKKVVKSNLERKELLNNLYFQNTLNPTGTYTLGGFPYLFFVKTFKATYSHFIDNLRRTFSFGFYYIRGVVFLLFIDACLTDDEPLWEPIEWSLVQSWILLIFAFAWIAENLIVSRYGSFTGRDKRVWMAWYKTFWLIEGFYALNYGAASIFVIVPFYFEQNYNVSFIYSWWHWYSRVFFFQFIASYSVILLMGHLLQINLRWINWKKGVIPILLINIFIAYLIYTHFIMVFFGYFTDPVWYQKSRPVDYIQLSHEPSRWGWGPAKKDHFTYHNVKTVFWFKNDGPFASSFLLFQLFLFVCLFFLFIFWLSLLRRVWSTKELPTTFVTYCVSALKQFFYFFLFFYILVFFSFLSNYMRLPWEYYYFLNNTSWLGNFFDILIHYFEIFLFI